MPHDGALQELVQGMLKIRGDLTKSEANPETSSLSVVGSMPMNSCVLALQSRTLLLRFWPPNHCRECSRR